MRVVRVFVCDDRRVGFQQARNWGQCMPRRRTASRIWFIWETSTRPGFCATCLSDISTVTSTSVHAVHKYTTDCRFCIRRVVCQWHIHFVVGLSLYVFTKTKIRNIDTSLVLFNIACCCLVSLDNFSCLSSSYTFFNQSIYRNITFNIKSNKNF